VTCHKCHQLGHYSDKCPMVTNSSIPSSKSSVTCHKCHQLGHYSDKCPNAAKPKVVTCYRCGQQGHYSEKCPNGENERKALTGEPTEERKQLPKSECVICCDDSPNCTFDCGHLCTCMSCAVQISECPLCRLAITTRIKTYTV
jgi:hypothetical protein